MSAAFAAEDRPLGILTFHRCINNGSFWQARCLADGLAQRGAAVEILDHHARRATVAEWRCALRPTLPTAAPREDRRGYRAKMTKFFDAVDTLPLSSTFELDDPRTAPEYDTIVVGSDEVWNLRHPWYGRAPAFFGEGLRARRLVAYAASFGNHDAGDGLDPEWAERLRRFDSIAVRDQNSLRLVEDAIGITPPVVLDPCLQFPPDTPDVSVPQTPFVAVYGHNFSASIIEAARTWASARAVPIVSIGYRNDWADTQWLDAGPLEFAAAIAVADAVVTNFFHGVVFALNNDRPFVCERTAYRGNKLQGLTDQVGASDRLMSERSSPTTFAAALGEPIDPAVHDTINDLRSVSTRFLDAALG